MNASLAHITGYRTNEDGTETLAWEVRDDGFVTCAHLESGCCVRCFWADHRLYRNYDGRVIARFSSIEAYRAAFPA